MDTTVILQLVSQKSDPWHCGQKEKAWYKMLRDIIIGIILSGGFLDPSVLDQEPKLWSSTSVAHVNNIGLHGDITPAVVIKVPGAFYVKGQSHCQILFDQCRFHLFLTPGTRTGTFWIFEITWRITCLAVLMGGGAPDLPSSRFFLMTLTTCPADGWSGKGLDF